MPTLRPARSEDIPGLVALLHLLFTLEADFAVDPARQEEGLRLLLADGRALVLVAEHQGRVVGMVTGQLVISTAEGGPAVLVEDLVVDHGQRNLGLGRALLDGLSAWARDRGATRLQLLADRDNQAGLAFYRHIGWQTTALICLRLQPACLQGDTP